MKKMVTIKDIARIAGVSPSTVSGVINNNGRVGKETKEKILKVIKELNYRPNAVAKGLRSKNTRTVGLLLPSITNPFYPGFARGVEDTAHSYGYNVFLCNSDRSLEKEKEYIETLLYKQVDGLIFAAPIVGKKEIVSAVEHGAHVVVVSETLNLPLVDEVWINYVGGAKAITQYLIELGHERIGFIGGLPGLRRSQDRLAGYKLALKKAGIPVEEELIKLGDFTYESGYEQGLGLLKLQKRPTAIFAANDLMALGVLAALEDNKVKVPEEMSVVGYDDIELASYIRPKLTTVHLPNYEAGRLAMEALIKRRDNEFPKTKIRVTMETSLVIRESAASPR
ncbi:MAG TPA: LacI family DNA-binding transcriptional regulator [Bacillota bacterium]